MGPCGTTGPASPTNRRAANTWQNAPVTQEFLTKAQREQRAGEELADQLDALSKPLAERVLGRAIELDSAAQAEAEAAANTIDYDMLRDVALEVGISEDSLRKALLEELDTDKDHDVRPVERATVLGLIGRRVALLLERRIVGWIRGTARRFGSRTWPEWRRRCHRWPMIWRRVFGLVR